MNISDTTKKYSSAILIICIVSASLVGLLPHFAVAESGVTIISAPTCVGPGCPNSGQVNTNTTPNQATNSGPPPKDQTANSQTSSPGTSGADNENVGTTLQGTEGTQATSVQESGGGSGSSSRTGGSRQTAATICATEAAKILAEETGAAGVAVGFSGVVALTKFFFSNTDVPAQSKADIAGQTLHPAIQNQSAVSSKLSNISARLRDTCLKAIAIQMAQVVINQARDSIVNWIQTGNFGNKPTFVTNFQFDAKQTASNAVRTLASQLTGINFCNYVPLATRNLNININFKVGLQCSYQATPRQYLAGLADPDSVRFDARVLSQADDSDPAYVAMNLAAFQTNVISQATEARKTQVTSGKGFVGIEKCVEEKITQEGYYINKATGQRCQVDESGPPSGCDYVPPVKACVKKEQQTPGAYAADLASEPIKSLIREKEVVTSLEQAIAVIVNAAVGTLINKGLGKAGL